MTALHTLQEAAEQLQREANDWEQLAQSICTLLYDEADDYDWVGIYMLRDEETLALTHWAGDQATEHTEIAIGQGICGLAAREERTVNVKNVNARDEYLACFVSTRSELVVPIMKDGTVIGEIDIDSDSEAAFDREDEEFVEGLAAIIADLHGAS